MFWTLFWVIFWKFWSDKRLFPMFIITKKIYTKSVTQNCRFTQIEYIGTFI